MIKSLNKTTTNAIVYIFCCMNGHEMHIKIMKIGKILPPMSLCLSLAMSFAFPNSYFTRARISGAIYENLEWIQWMVHASYRFQVTVKTWNLFDTQTTLIFSLACYSNTYERSNRRLIFVGNCELWSPSNWRYTLAHTISIWVEICFATGVGRTYTYTRAINRRQEPAKAKPREEPWK